MAFQAVDEPEEELMSRDQRRQVDALVRGPGLLGGQSVEELRQGFARMMAMMQVPGTVRTSDTTLRGRRAVRVEPETAGSGTILYFHGGSFVVGSPETAMPVTANLVARSGIPAISLDYRLAPEHPFPAGLEDALTAYRELLDDGVQPTSIAFAGDSAGGGIAITTCLMAKDAGLPLPGAVVTFSAGLDATRTGDSMQTKEGIDPYFTRESLMKTGVLYLGEEDPLQPLLSPAVCADLAGFPPLLLQVGTNEVLLNDSTRLAERAREAGVDVVLDVTADVPHVFQAFSGILDEADQAVDRAALFLRQHLQG